MATNADIQSIVDYFGSDSSIYRKIVFGQATDSEISFALSQIPRMQIDKTASGTVLGYSYADPVYLVPTESEIITGGVDSNVGGSDYGSGLSANYPVSFARDESGAFIQSANTAGQTIAAVADRVSLGLIGVNLGCKLGKAIDETLYNIDPDWWDTHYPTINPETWPSLVGENDLGQKFFRTLFGIKDGNVTGYIDERVLAQTYQLLRDNGLWKDKETVDYPAIGKNKVFTNEDVAMVDVVASAEGPIIKGVLMARNRYGDLCVMYNLSKNVYTSPKITTTGPYTVTTTNGYFTPSPLTFDVDLNVGKPFSKRNQATNWEIGSSMGRNFSRVGNNEAGLLDNQILIDATLSSPGIDGITNIDDATQYPPTNITGTTLDDVLNQLKTEYPQLFEGSIQEQVLQPDGSIQNRNYVPIPWQVNNPLDKSQQSPTTTATPTQSTNVDPGIALDLITHTQTPPFSDTTTPPPPEAPTTGTGNVDPSPIPTGSASSLWAIYNPTQSQVNAFGSWLWSSDFVEQLKKLFSDPMQAIIGIHKVFATPHTGNPQTIKCGYLDSNVSSAVVTSQYTDVDCGSVNLREYFGNVFDYSPFTEVKLYLPFIGIVPLDVGYAMRSTIAVKYRVDVLTGACLANVEITRDGGGGVIYSYGGSAIVSYPISSGSYTGIVSGALSLMAGVIGTVASGGSALPAVIGAASGVGRMKTEVQHSGQFSGAAGAMGNKKPYLIISRPQTRVAGNVKHYSGIPANSTIQLSSCRGYTRINEVHLSIPNAFDSELTEIENLLRGGVII